MHDCANYNTFSQNILLPFASVLLVTIKLESDTISHAALTLLNRDIFRTTSDDVVFLASPYTFDPFIVQMFLAFAAGARIAIVPDSIKGMPSKLCHILFDEERVTILQVRFEFIWKLAKQFCFQNVIQVLFCKCKSRLCVGQDVFLSNSS